jgi:hypothetical protein
MDILLPIEYQYVYNSKNNYSKIDLKNYSQFYDYVSISDNYISILDKSDIKILDINNFNIYKSLLYPITFNDIKNILFINNNLYISDNTTIYNYDFNNQDNIEFKSIYTTNTSYEIIKLYNNNSILDIYVKDTINTNDYYLKKNITNIDIITNTNITNTNITNTDIKLINFDIFEIYNENIYYINNNNNTLMKYDIISSTSTSILNINLSVKILKIFDNILYLYGDTGLYRIDLNLEIPILKQTYSNVLTNDELSNSLKLYINKKDSHTDIYLQSKSNLYVFNNDTYCIINVPLSNINKTWDNSKLINTNYMNSCLLLTNILIGDDVYISTDNKWTFDTSYIGNDKTITSSKEIKLNGNDSKYYNLIYYFICNPLISSSSKVYLSGNIIP